MLRNKIAGRPDHTWLKLDTDRPSRLAMRGVAYTSIQFYTATPNLDFATGDEPVFEQEADARGRNVFEIRDAMPVATAIVPTDLDQVGAEKAVVVSSVLHT